MHGACDYSDVTVAVDANHGIVYRKRYAVFCIEKVSVHDTSYVTL